MTSVDDLRTISPELEQVLARVEAQALAEPDSAGPLPTREIISQVQDILVQTAQEMAQHRAGADPAWSFPLGAVTTDGEGAIRIEWPAGRELNVVLVVGESLVYTFSKLAAEEAGSISKWTAAGLAASLHEVCKARATRTKE